MTERWHQDFDFFQAAVAPSVVASVFVDLAASEHAPVASHPVRLAVRARMLEPREDGQRSDREADALLAMEDRVTDAVTSGLDAVFVGRLVAQGMVTLVFYIPGESVPLADELTKVTGMLAPYAIEWNLDDDPHWDFYRELLYPDAKTLAAMKSRRAADRVMGRVD